MVITVPSEQIKLILRVPQIETAYLPDVDF